MALLRTRLKFYSCSVAVYLILLGFVTWPAILYPGLLAGPPLGDRGANLWNLWWIAHSIQTASDPRWTDLVFHPDGCPLLHHSLSLANGVVFAPLTLTLGPAGTYGVAFLLWSLLTGLGGIIWSRKWLPHRQDQWLVGFFLTFAAYRFAHLDHLNLFSTAGIPWSFWAFDRLREHPKLENGALCGLLWTVTTFSCWYYGVVVGVYGLCRLTGFVHDQRNLPAWCAGLLPFAVVCVFVWAYVSLPLPGPYVEPDRISDVAKVYWSLSVDGILWPMWIYPGELSAEFRIHPGIVFLLLAAVHLACGTPNGQKRFFFLILVAAVYTLLALGPMLKVGGFATDFPLPAYLFRFVPGLGHVKVFTRFLYPAMICLAPVAVNGLRSITERICTENPNVPARVIARLTFASMLLVFWFEQSLPPFGTWPVAENKTWQSDQMVIAAAQKTSGSVLEIPFIPSELVGMHLARQTRHAKPLVIGEVSRLQGYRRLFLEKYPSLSQLNLLATDTGIWTMKAIRSAAEQFAQDQEKLGVGVVIVSLRYCVSDTKRRLSLFIDALPEECRPQVVYDVLSQNACDAPGIYLVQPGSASEIAPPTGGIPRLFTARIDKYRRSWSARYWDHKE